MSVNKVILVGFLGKDPETKYTTDGSAITNFSLATVNRWRDKGTGESKKKTEWHRIVAFGRLGEICDQYLFKGKQVYIEGSIQYRSWEDSDGNVKYMTEIVAREMQMLGKKGDDDRDQSQRNNGGQRQQPAEQDDDIPF